MLQRYLTLLALLLCSHVACQTKSSSLPPSVIVAAASDLVKASQPLGAAFERQSGIKAVFSFGASGQLEQQIRQGAPFDVLLSASLSYCRSLEQEGLTQGQPRVFAIGLLAAWSPTQTLQSLEELKLDRMTRVALANPNYAPYGVAARQALQSAGLWEALQPKLVFADSVAHAFQMAETGNVEIALVALALVQDTDRPLLLVDTRLYQPIEQCVLVTKYSPHPQAAGSFQEFLSTAEARQILQDYGFVFP